MGFDEVMQLIWNKKVKEVKSIVSEDFKKYIDLRDHNDRTLLSYAAIYGNLELMKFFVENKFDINHQDNAGYTPLFLAIQDKHLSIIEYLFDIGANVEILPSYTAYGVLGELSFNLKTASSDLLKKMIDNDVKLVGADLKAILRGENTDVYKYILEKRKLTAKEIVESLEDLSGTVKEKIEFLGYLLDNEFIDINESPYGSETLFSIIVKKSNNDKLAKFLIEKGADLSFQGTGVNCLLEMSKSQKLDIVKLLVKNGVNVKTINQFNQNALHCEAQWSSGGKESKLSETFEYLVSQGLELTVKDTYDDKSPIEYLIDSNRVFSVKHVFKNIISEVVNKIDLETDEFLFKVLLSIQEYPNKKEKELLLDTFAKFPKLLSHFDDQLYESKLKLREMAIKVLININDDKSIELLKGRAETESNKGLLKLLNKYLENK